MRKKSNTSRVPCQRCGALLGGNNHSGVCAKCDGWFRCVYCRQVWDRQKDDPYTCLDCREVLARMADTHENECRAPVAGVEERVARMAGRAAKGLPLFREG